MVPGLVPCLLVCSVAYGAPLSLAELDGVVPRKWQSQCFFSALSFQSSSFALVYFKGGPRSLPTSSRRHEVGMRLHSHAQ